MHPAYKNSRIVSKAAAASRLIVTTSGYVGQALQSQADGFTQRTKPTSKPLTFNPTTHAHIRRIHTFSEGAAGLSAKTVAQVQKYAQNLGAAMARRSESERAVKGIGPDGQPVENYKPGLLNKSMMAFSTVADGIDQAARNLLASTSTAATTVVGHRFGPEAGEISRNLSGGFKNVALVYIDASGVSRRAIVKSVAKGVVVGRVRGGGDLVVGGGGGGGGGGGDGGGEGGVAVVMAVVMVAKSSLPRRSIGKRRRRRMGGIPTILICMVGERVLKWLVSVELLRLMGWNVGSRLRGRKSQGNGSFFVIFDVSVSFLSLFSRSRQAERAGPLLFDTGYNTAWYSIV